MAISKYNEKAVQPIIQFMKSKGLNDNGICGLLGNLYSESRLYPNNLQNSYNTKLGMTDEEYTLAVVNNIYTNFTNDKAGYGLAQWTSSGRKSGLLDYCKKNRKAIDDLQAQLEWLYTELSTSYKTVLFELTNPNNTIDSCARIVMVKFERPANQSEENQLVRVGYAKDFYNTYFKGADVPNKPQDKVYSRNTYIEQMRHYIGAKDGNALHKEIIATYNSYVPHPRGHKLNEKDAWCAGTVSACAIAVGYTDIIPIECSCTKMIELANQKGIWNENDAYVPKVSDLILYDWEDNGIGDCKGQPNHIGAVESVVNGMITVIEGNYGGECKRRTLPINGRYIRGYICPKYTDIPVSDNSVYYTVVKGDNLYRIAKKYNTTVPAIVRLNPQIDNPNLIHIGQQIRVK